MRICTETDCDRKHYGRGFCSLHYQRMKLHGSTAPLGETEAERASRFWSRVNRTTGDACWEWQGTVHPNGYGILTMRKLRQSPLKAHRLSYMFTHGSIPPGAYILHHCDNRLCCNPAHLYAGSQARNLRDLADRNRRKGELQCNHKLSDAQVLEIRARASQGETNRALGRVFGVSHSTVDHIVNRQSWVHLG